MEFKVENNSNHIIIRCNSDKLNALVAPELKSLFLHHSNNGVNAFVVDLENVKYCDSSGLSALLVGNRILKEKEGKLVIFGINPMVQKIITISQLNTVFNIFENEQIALNNIKWKIL